MNPKIALAAVAACSLVATNALGQEPATWSGGDAVAPAPTPGSTQPPEAERSDDGEVPYDGPLGTYQDHWQIAAGTRVQFVPSSDYDPFSENNTFTQWGISAGRTIWSEDRVSMLVTTGWDYGSTEADARGEDTRLLAHRLSLGPEARFHLIPQLYGFTRVSATALYVEAQIEETVTDSTLSRDAWLAGFDATVGVGGQIWGRKSGSARQPRMWAFVEGGYGWTTAMDLMLEADSSAPVRTAALDLGQVALRGALIRASVAMTF